MYSPYPFFKSSGYFSVSSLSVSLRSSFSGGFFSSSCCAPSFKNPALPNISVSVFIPLFPSAKSPFLPLPALSFFAGLLRSSAFAPFSSPPFKSGIYTALPLLGAFCIKLTGFFAVTSLCTLSKNSFLAGFFCALFSLFIIFAVLTKFAMSFSSAAIFPFTTGSAPVSLTGPFAPLSLSGFTPRR